MKKSKQTTPAALEVLAVAKQATALAGEVIEQNRADQKARGKRALEVYAARQAARRGKGVTGKRTTTKAPMKRSPAPLLASLDKFLAELQAVIAQGLARAEGKRSK